MLKALAIIATILTASASARAALKTRTVDYQQGDTALQGYLVYDDTRSGPRPAVLVVHEWWGLDDYAKHRADEMARRGYVAFAVDMYGKGVIAKTPAEAGKLAGALKSNRRLMRDRIEAALKTLRQQPNVDGKRVGAMGYCFGGTVVLELARDGADVSAVVSFHGGLDRDPNTPTRPITAKVLICHGADDKFVPEADLLAIQQELREAKADWQINIYGNAVHGFTNPAADSLKMPGLAYNAEADRRSSQAMQDLFNETLNPSAPAPPAAPAAK